MLLDREDRDRAIHERGRNVIVEASAGTGKTRLVIDRLLALVAPVDGGVPLPIDRIAAITFTRKAAGELRVRARQRLLEELAADQQSPRAELLARALAGIDTAHITTIHGFADRLLRMWPAQSRLDPLYQLEDDNAGLVDDCFQLLVHGAETGTLGDVLRGTTAEAYVDEATATIVDFQRAGLRLRSLETEHWTYHGLDGLIAGLVLHRDVDVAEPVQRELDRATFANAVNELSRAIERVSAHTPGGRWLAESARLARQLVDESEATVVFRELVERFVRGPRGRASELPRRGHDFGGDRVAWEAWKLFDATLRDQVLEPLRSWLATKLVRLRPVVLEVYEAVKARRRVVDHVDLLVRLRSLLRDDVGVRRACQNMFDHVFVDEFQDTDPLQAEIVVFLCENGAHARSWDVAELAPGKLTIVGDPKQSIYRFRRADIATYRQVVELASRSPHLSIRLTSSFRSAPALVDWINVTFADILAPTYSALTAARAQAADQPVHAIAIEPPEDNTAAACRDQEARAMARYVRWLVENSGLTVIDTLAGTPRTIRYADIGVLAMTTTNLPVLFAAFDADEVPYASRGGTLFLRDRVHRQFLLGLAAIADRDDGVANAALLRPPFFAVDLGDLARRSDSPGDRAVQARATVTELRRRRFARTPGETARALLEETAFGRSIALGPNGSQRVAALRELCFQLEARALAEQLDFDGAMERLRAWIDYPPGLDRPHPVGSDAVRVMTVHQAKGLEFPVVVLWDARAMWSERTTYDPWTVDRNGRGWSMRLDMLQWEEPAGLDLVTRERAMREDERKRLVYVAATRARDLLVIPKLGAPDGRSIFGKLLAKGSAAVLEQELHGETSPARWYVDAMPNTPASIEVTTDDVPTRRRWVERARASARECMRPTAFTDAAAPRALWGRHGRFGRVFGETVHLAIGHALRGRSDAVARAAETTGLRTNLSHARDDVTRTMFALAGLRISNTYQLEYPVSGLNAEGALISGYLDLIALVGSETILLDFKTDTPPALHEPLPERYVAQVRGYANVVEARLGSAVRAGLLYTADGGIRWLA